MLMVYYITMGDFLSKDAALDAARIHFPLFREHRTKMLKLESWLNGEQYEASEDLDEEDRFYGRPFSPNRERATREYENLRALSPNNFASLIAKSVSQLCHIEGISRPGQTGILPIWDTLRRNRWASKQNSIHYEAAGIGLAYGTVLPGEDPITGKSMARMSAVSAVDMLALYDSPDDEWARFAISAEPTRIEDEKTGIKYAGWNVRLWDSYVIHNLQYGDVTAASDKSGWTYISYDWHGIPVPPVCQLANRVTLRGEAYGEIEPVIPLLRRIDQDLFDRLINQRFGAWQVRYIAGMAKPEKKEAQAEQSMKLRVEDLLVSTSPETKFGTLPAGDIKGQVDVTDADLRLLSAVAQVPPHHLLGQSSNLQAEALAAATEGLQRKAFEFRLNAAEFHEQMARLAAMVEGDMATAQAWDIRVRWRDEQSGSMSQAADALGKLATQLGVPIELLWERIPGWTDDDVQRAKELVESGKIDAILEQLLNDSAAEKPVDGEEEKPEEE